RWLADQVDVIDAALVRHEQPPQAFADEDPDGPFQHQRRRDLDGPGPEPPPAAGVHGRPPGAAGAGQLPALVAAAAPADQAQAPRVPDGQDAGAGGPQELDLPLAPTIRTPAGQLVLLDQ